MLYWILQIRDGSSTNQEKITTTSERLKVRKHIDVQMGHNFIEINRNGIKLYLNTGRYAL